MNNKEFRQEFHLLYNNIFSNHAPGINDYELSLLLTQAQESLVLALYNGDTEKYKSFEITEEYRQYLSNLVKTMTIQPAKTEIQKISDTSVFFEKPADLWFITYESVGLQNPDDCAGFENITVLPIKQDEYHKIKKNPFRGATKKRVLRLDVGNYVEIVSEKGNKATEYSVRYLKHPNPIILTDLGDLKIDGVSTETECELHEALHRKILNVAVALAKATFV